MDEKNTGHKTYLVNLLQNPSTRILYWKIINGPVDHREMQKKKNVDLEWEDIKSFTSKAAMETLGERKHSQYGTEVDSPILKTSR